MMRRQGTLLNLIPPTRNLAPRVGSSAPLEAPRGAMPPAWTGEISPTDG